jgi:peptidoglycan/xylan/chitin deacetylase (PgdA/CDA1 family)
VTQPETRPAAPLATLRLEPAPDLPHLAWAEGLSFRLPRAILLAAGLSGGAEPVPALSLGPDRRRPGAEQVEQHRLRAAFTECPPLSCQLPFSYQFVPSALRSLLARLLGRRLRHREQQWADFPAWPLDLSSDLLEDWASGRRSPWADGTTPVVLSHDLDSAEGARNLVHRFLDLEERVGARSTNFVVPCAWPVDHGLLREVQRRGHEIGIHGYDHSNRTSFLPAEQQTRRLLAGAQFGAPYDVRGYRSPSLLRTRSLIAGLSRHYAYDSSIPTSGGPFPVPNNGCASARPFRLADLIELPLSLPRDGSLLFLGYRPAAITDLWQTCAEHVHRSGGVVVLLTHCEQRFSGGPAMLSAYRAFLEHLAGDRRFRWRTAWEVVQEASRHRAGNLPPLAA